MPPKYSDNKISQKSQEKNAAVLVKFRSKPLYEIPMILNLTQSDCEER